VDYSTALTVLWSALAALVVLALVVPLVGDRSTPPSRPLGAPTTASSTSTSVATTTAPTTTTTLATLSASPAALVAGVNAAATRAGSVHLFATAGGAGTMDQWSLDVGRLGAQGTVSVGGSPVGVVVIGQTVYLQGGASALAALGVPAASVARAAGRWVSLPGTTKGLGPLGALTFPQVVAGLFNPVPPLSATAGTGLTGAPVARLAGTLPSTALTTGWGVATSPSVLQVPAQGTLLPVELVATPSAGTPIDYGFTDWGEPVNLVAPANALPLAGAAA
jgi:hypothetical protein